jgi:hypothetical protein
MISWHNLNSPSPTSNPSEPPAITYQHNFHVDTDIPTPKKKADFAILTTKFGPGNTCLTNFAVHENIQRKNNCKPTKKEKKTN